jgi:desulfoferrodoxin (superoxide reductase-like protein)
MTFETGRYACLSSRKDGIYMPMPALMSHPMEPDHYIEWMLLESEARRICYLKPGDEPKADLSAR